MPSPLFNANEERVVFENWETEGCHVFVDHKHLLTLSTPESSAVGSSYNTLLDDWISPDEFCDSLGAVLLALGASPVMLAAVEQERANYRERPPRPPTRTRADLMHEIGVSLD